MRTRLLGGLAVGLVTLIVLHVLLYNAYWDYSEGVYALTARLWLHGGSLYDRIIGAQPPGVFVAGVALLAIHDSVEWLRFGVACMQLGAGLIAGQIVFRITGSRVGGMLTPAAILITPWAVHEHGLLTPELVVLPFMLGALLLSVDEKRAPLAGTLCGLLPLIKVPFVLPALALIALSAKPRETALWAAGASAIGLGITTLFAGGDFWRDAFIAQTQTGSVSLGVIGGFWAQAVWNLLGLLLCSAALVRYRSLGRDQRLLRATLGLAVTDVIMLLTNFKQGTALNITVPIEGGLVPAAACGAVFAFRAARSARSPIRPRLIAAGCGLAIAFTLAQSVSLLASPHDAVPFERPGSSPAWEITMTASRLRAEVAAARACPPGEAYAGPPLIAFIANRSVPDNQPDAFITTHASALASVARARAAVKPVCANY